MIPAPCNKQLATAGQCRSLADQRALLKKLIEPSADEERWASYWMSLPLVSSWHAASAIRHAFLGADPVGVKGRDAIVTSLVEDGRRARLIYDQMLQDIWRDDDETVFSAGGSEGAAREHRIGYLRFCGSASALPATVVGAVAMHQPQWIVEWVVYDASTTVLALLLRHKEQSLCRDSDTSASPPELASAVMRYVARVDQATGGSAGSDAASQMSKDWEIIDEHDDPALPNARPPTAVTQRIRSVTFDRTTLMLQARQFITFLRRFATFLGCLEDVFSIFGPCCVEEVSQDRGAGRARAILIRFTGGLSDLPQQDRAKRAASDALHALIALQKFFAVDFDFVLTYATTEFINPDLLDSGIAVGSVGTKRDTEVVSSASKSRRNEVDDERQGRSKRIRSEEPLLPSSRSRGVVDDLPTVRATTSSYASTTAAADHMPLVEEARTPVAFPLQAVTLEQPSLWAAAPSPAPPPPLPSLTPPVYCYSSYGSGGPAVPQTPPFGPPASPTYTPRYRCPYDGNCSYINDPVHQSEYMHVCTVPAPCPYISHPSHGPYFIHY